MTKHGTLPASQGTLRSNVQRSCINSELSRSTSGPYKHPIRVRLLSYTRDGLVVLEGIDFESEMGSIRGGQLALVATARALDNWISEDLLGCWCQLSILG